MKQEISAALDLLTSYIQRFGSIKEESIEQFRTELEKVLLERYQGHWYAGKNNWSTLGFLFTINFRFFFIIDKPIKGQAYRSLEFNKENNLCDANVAQVCRQLGFTPDLLGIRHELTLWIDPCEISIRYVVSWWRC